ncbi:hypothetical protein TH25_20805 [Thalassospira profundimaris]|uniref:Lipoprotein n=1 Tax=Thalassospira profundimaris TaxID=502049 RepID=A0A367WTV9_9PROT|nr:hypothetical protein [Thalassospira profundimaris]RCK43882.1 hypothetical protein TH25_20805 [Thalassospira profundimaris]
MEKSVFAGLLLGAVMVLGGCEITQQDAHQSLVEEIRYRGNNPYIKDAELKELEKRIQTIAVAPDTQGAPYEAQFNPRNQAILDNFNDQYDHAAMMRDINLARTGFEAAVAARYPRIGVTTDCDIADKNAFFINIEDQPNRFDWQFMQGDCQNGLAHGVARAAARNPDAEFVGRFDNGIMLDGVFTTTLPDGVRLIQIGGIPYEGRIARLLTSKFDANGFQWHRYGDFNIENSFDGFGINIWGYTNKMVVYAAGHFANKKLNGFSAKQALRDVEDAKVWMTWMGMYVDDQLNGLGAWTNGLNRIQVGQWKDGSLHGIVYGQFASYYGDHHEFYVGRYENGNRQGAFQVLAQNSFAEEEVVEHYQNGNYVDNSEDDFDFGQLFVAATGAAIIGGADIPDAAKLDIGTAFIADVMGDTGGTNMQSLQNTYQQQKPKGNGTLGAAGTTTNVAGTGDKPAGDLNTYNAQITCEQTGITRTIPVPYRTEACRIAAIDFAQTFACNKLDQERVTRNCQSACGHPQCLQQ